MPKTHASFVDTLMIHPQGCIFNSLPSLVPSTHARAQNNAFVAILYFVPIYVIYTWVFASLLMAVTYNSYIKRNKVCVCLRKMLEVESSFLGSVWPLMQCQLKPVFVDADPVTLNMDLDDLERKLKAHPNAKGIMASLFTHAAVSR